MKRDRIEQRKTQKLLNRLQDMIESELYISKVEEEPSRSLIFKFKRCIQNLKRRLSGRTYERK